MIFSTNTFILNIMKPKILIIGNKEVDFPISDEKIKFINSFDIIVRVNRMNNFFETGQRVDWWWLDHNIKNFKFFNIFWCFTLVP